MYWKWKRNKIINQFSLTDYDSGVCGEGGISMNVPYVGILQYIFYPILIWIALPAFVIGLVADRKFDAGKKGSAFGALIGALLLFSIGPYGMYF
jgi:hypothetical protein